MNRHKWFVHWVPSIRMWGVSKGGFRAGVFKKSEKHLAEKERERLENSDRGEI